MTSSGASTEFRTGPLYFFGQPAKRNRMKCTRSIFYFNEGKQSEDTLQSFQANDNKDGKSEDLTESLSSESCGVGKHDTPSGAALNIKDQDRMNAYKRAAPQLLNDLAGLLSQHKRTEKWCIPQGIVNILNYSWHDLTAGAVYLNSPEQANKVGEAKASLKLDEADEARARQVSANDKRETRERNSCVVENIDPSVRKPEGSSNQHMKCRKKDSKAHNSSTLSFSISAASTGCGLCPGWIMLPEQPSCDDPQWISLCQWVVQRLQMARNPEKLQTADQDLNDVLLLRHYGDAKPKVKDRREKRMAQSVTLVNGMPLIPEVKQQDPALQKLHYRITDGSSFIYYPSGCVAVCQSHSGLPCGGFYANVFSDSECPVILATITAFGHGAVTHSLNSAVTAVWDPDGGFMCDHHGNITKEWSWQTGCTLRDKIVIQVSDSISLRLLSSTSAMLRFRCDNEHVKLPLSSISNMNQSKDTPSLQTEIKFTSAAVSRLGETKSPAVVLNSKKNPTLSHMVRDVEVLEETPAQWRRGGHFGRELKRLQQRARNTLDDWLDYYRVAIGIKCPDMKRIPDAPLRGRLRTEVQSGALPSLNPPERADAKPVQPEKERAPDSYVKLPRTAKKQTKEEPHVTRIGPLQIRGNIKPESVIILNGSDSQPSAVTCRPGLPPFTPTTPLTLCPVLLRSALLEEGGRRRCCCSAKLMPVVTDLEYDSFIMGQPPHSQQILVVCVSPSCQPAVSNQDVLEQLYRRKNKHRTAPCTQCQMDSFRLVRYETLTRNLRCGANILLQERHNAAPGMVLMYIRGKLLFVGYVFSGDSCSVRDLPKQISRSRADYRLGLSLPSDYKFSETVTTPAATDADSSHTATLKGGDDIKRAVSAEN